MKKITDPDEMFDWIINNKDKMSRETLIMALERWGFETGYTSMNGSDFLWCLENIK
jgi:hypothetical protein